MRIAPLLALALSLPSLPASAQPEFFFGTGEAPVFRESDLDTKFTRSRLAQALRQGTTDTQCVQLVGGLLTLLGETAPLLHKRDENFFLDPVLVQALGTQLSTVDFPANAFFVAMVRRTLIDKKMPADWLVTAEALQPYYPGIDLGKLRFLMDGVRPVDSFLLTLPALRERYAEEVKKVNSVAAPTAEALFRDNYLDHEVAFGGLELVDVKLEKPKKKRRKRGEPEEPPTLVARLIWTVPKPPPRSQLDLVVLKPPKPEQVHITARLQDMQYVDLNKLLKGTRVLVRGRFWEYKKGLGSLELRDALLFLDRDWSTGANLANPAAIAACPLAVNDLTGIAPLQPGAFGQFR